MWRDEEAKEADQTLAVPLTSVKQQSNFSKLVQVVLTLAILVLLQLLRGGIEKIRERI